MTLVELVVAAGLLALLSVAIFGMVRDFVRLWDRTEVRRQLVEESSAVLDLMARDLSALEPGGRGDLVLDWVLHDVDGNGVRESKWPRLAFVRHAAPREIALHQAGRADPILGEGLFEVLWTVVPARGRERNPERVAEGLLVRGERLVGDPDSVSFFALEAFSSGGLPAPGSTEEVASGILWMRVLCAGPTSVLRRGWRLGQGMEEVSPSWDAWRRDRPDADQHPWNEPWPHLPRAGPRPILPRRVLVELEIERDRDRLRRTRLARALDARDSVLEVEDPSRLPAEGHLLVDGEWMELVSVLGRSATVRRAARGTPAAVHAAGAMVHHGPTTVREVPIAPFQEDWNL
jgi:hypothetical protein